MSQGAVAIDRMEELPAQYQQWVSSISRYLHVGYFAVDFIVNNLSGDPKSEAVLLEINAKPEWVHHTFSERRQHNIAGMVLDELFGSLTD